MMNWNTDRIARLSGLISRDEYRDNALNESINRSQVFEADAESEDSKEKDVDDEPTDGEASDSVEEARLRSIIRKEVGQVIDEVMAAREATQLNNAQKSRSVSAVMGFSSDAFRPRTNRPNRAASRGPGGKKGFGGPGFM